MTGNGDTYIGWLSLHTRVCCNVSRLHSNVVTTAFRYAHFQYALSPSSHTIFMAAATARGFSLTNSATSPTTTTPYNTYRPSGMVRPSPTAELPAGQLLGK
jgi:hypothetical protein